MPSTPTKSPRKASPSASSSPHLPLISRQSRPASISSADSLASDEFDDAEEQQLDLHHDRNSYDEEDEEGGYSLTSGVSGANGVNGHGVNRGEEHAQVQMQVRHFTSGSPKKDRTPVKGKGKDIKGKGKQVSGGMDEVDQFLQDEGFGTDDDDEDEGSPSPSRSRRMQPIRTGREAGPGADEEDGDDEREQDSSSTGFLSQDDRDQMEFDELLDEEAEFGAAGHGGAGSRRRRRWEGDDKERSLFELIPPLLLSHPMALLPLLSLIPYDFLPAGVVLFVPIFCGLVILSACAHIVIVYLAWYLKVPSFEDVFAACAAKYGVYGLWGGRVFVLCSTLGVVVGWLGTLHPLIQPLVDRYVSGFLASRVFWTIIASATLLPTLIPSRMTRPLRNAPVVLALLVPIIAFLVIGRTVEIKKAAEAAAEVTSAAMTAAATEEAGVVVKRQLVGASSAGGGLTALTVFLTPHLNTLPIHATLNRNKRMSFPIPLLATSTILLVLCLPFALVPYYLLPTTEFIPSPSAPSDSPATSLSTSVGPSGVFAHLPADDGWINLARVLMCLAVLGSANMWIVRGRDSLLRAVGGDRSRIARWSGLVIWLVVVSLACIGGWVADKIETVGVIATLAVGWLLPSIFFIITFHVRSPLAIIMQPNTRIYHNLNPGSSTPHSGSTPSPAPTPGANPNASTSTSNGVSGPSSGRAHGHSRADSLQDPSIDVLLARKERQLQKRRVERRLWQDLIVYVGILPIGCLTIAWSVGRLLSIW